jgi:hypothetical protein
MGIESARNINFKGPNDESVLFSKTDAFKFSEMFWIKRPEHLGHSTERDECNKSKKREMRLFLDRNI